MSPTNSIPKKVPVGITGKENTDKTFNRELTRINANTWGCDRRSFACICGLGLLQADGFECPVDVLEVDVDIEDLVEVFLLDLLHDFGIGFDERPEILTCFPRFHGVTLDQTMAYYALLIVVVVLLIFVNRLRRSKYGLALQSIGEAEIAASSIGVNVNAVKVVTFAISAFFMGLVGAVMVTQWTYVDSRIAFNMFYSFMPVLMAICGGVRQIRGQIIGAVILTLLAEALLTEFPYYYMLLFGLLVIIFILFFPSGLIALGDKLRKRRKVGLEG